MSPLVAILILALLGAVVLVVSAPLRSRRHIADDAAATEQAGEEDGAVAIVEGLERHELEAAREAKYREIRDAEMDYRTGKLSEEDYRAIDTQLRAEALEILDRIEALTRGA